MDIEKHLFNISPTKIKLGLDRTYQLLKACGNPEKKIFSIQIVGTNGKGSTAAMLATILKEKYNVGLFTSPHLVDYKERIRINFKKIQNKEVEIFLQKHQKEIKKIQPSFFEIMTVLAVWYFYKNKVDIAILETGLGGRLDSVTCCNNNILGYTNIDFDHEHILGNSMKNIAKEKAYAMLSSTQEVYSVIQNSIVTKTLNERANELKIKIKNVKKAKLQHNLSGEHQLINASLAKTIAISLMCSKYFKITKKDIQKGLNRTVWPGRFQIITKKPTVIFDVAHNSAGIRSFVQTIKNYLKNTKHNNKILVCGFENNKKIKKDLKIVKKLFDSIICTETKTRKSLNCKELHSYFKDNKKTSYNSNINKVFDLIKKQNTDTLVCIIGSHYFGPYISKFYNKSFAKI